MTEKDPDVEVQISDRRLAERKKLIVDVRYEGGDSTGIANTRDFGIGGLYMTTTAALNIGAQLLMTINVEGRTLRLEGVVVYTDPGQGVGVRFQNISDEDLEFIGADLA